MFSSNFTWCDLSTYDRAKACDFYGRVLGWSDHRLEASTREDDYRVFYSGSRASAGVYTMPPQFQNMGMPSFWMSYVRVASLARSVEVAVDLGAKCEIEPTSFDTHSRFALIRDPSGAGFTLYEGPDLLGRDHDGRHGRMLWNELHVPSVQMVKGFYRDLFGWDIVPDRSLSYRHTVNSPSGDSIASIVELDEQTKGPKNYWAVIFATSDLHATLSAVTDSGGRVLMKPNSGIEFAMVADDQDAMFCVSDANAE